MLSSPASISTSLLLSVRIPLLQVCPCRWALPFFLWGPACDKELFGYWNILIETVACSSVQSYLSSWATAADLSECPELSRKDSYLRLCFPGIGDCHSLYFLGSASTWLDRPQMLSFSFPSLFLSTWFFQILLAFGPLHSSSGLVLYSQLILGR